MSASIRKDTLPRYTPGAIKENCPLIEAILDFGNKRELTAAQVSLAWLLAQKPWVVPFPERPSSHRPNRKYKALFDFRNQVSPGIS